MNGPWSVIEHSWSDISVVSADRTICTLSILDEATEDTQDELEERAAKVARLIAAAPELRDDCELLCIWLKAALACPLFPWDADQHEAATESLASAEARLKSLQP